MPGPCCNDCNNNCKNVSGGPNAPAKPNNPESFCDNPLGICLPSYKSRGSSRPMVETTKLNKPESLCDNPLGICLPSYKSRGSSGPNVETAKPHKTESCCDNPMSMRLPSYKSCGSSGPIVETAKPHKTESCCDNPMTMRLPSYKSCGSSGPNVETVNAVMTGPLFLAAKDSCISNRSRKIVGDAKAGKTEAFCDHSRDMSLPAYKKTSGPIVATAVEEVQTWRRKCGCIRTSEKLKHILTDFPSPPPPSPAPYFAIDKQCCPYPGMTCMDSMDKAEYIAIRKGANSRSWHVVAELVQLVQLSVTATALALYYLIYCYMQLVYYTLRSALYFHNADGPMKITIGVVTVTSLVIGFNLLLRMERILGILY